jgi:replication factor C small subunit
MTPSRGGPVAMEHLRPATLEEIVGQATSIARLRRLADGVRDGRIVPTHVLMHGPPGVGKTTAARAFGRVVLGEDWENSFHEIRASDNRSVPQVRDHIVDLARRPPSRHAPFRVIFLDEADELLPKAQNALRPALEDPGGSTVFLLACNQLHRVSRPIQSRCTVLPFTPLAPEDLRRVVVEAADRVGRTLEPSVVETIVDRAAGIPREAVKLVIEEFGAPSAILVETGPVLS